MSRPAQELAVLIRSMTELDIEGIIKIDERVTGKYRPDVWEKRLTYYIRRDPDASQIATVGGKIVGFMMGEVRGGEFGLEEPTGWVEHFGVDPAERGKDIGRKLIEALFVYFRQRGAQVVRTVVSSEQQDIAKFLAAVGFAGSSLSILEKRPL